MTKKIKFIALFFYFVFSLQSSANENKLTMPEDSTKKSKSDTIRAKVVYADHLFLNGKEIKQHESKKKMGDAKEVTPTETITLVFYGNGKLAGFEGLGKEYKSGTKFSLYVKIKEDKKFLQNKFRDLFDNYLTAIGNLKDEEYINTLTHYYQFNTTDIASIIKEYTSQIYYINEICTYNKELKEAYTNLNFNEIDITKKEYFNALYTFKINVDGKDAVKNLNQGDQPVLITDSFDYTKELNYELRFEKPEARIVKTQKASIFSAIPSLTLFNEQYKLNKMISDTIQVIKNRLERKEELIKDSKGDHKKEIESLCAHINRSMELLLDTNIKVQTSYRKPLQNFKKYKEWIKLWLWYNTNEPQVNPFTLNNPVSNKINLGLIKTKQTQLNGYKVKKQYLDTVLRKLPMKEKVNDNLVFHFADTLMQLEQKITSLQSEISELQGKVTENNQSQKNTKSKLESDKIMDHYLYAGKLYLGNKNKARDSIVYIIHDIDQNFELMRGVRTNYDEGVLVKVVGENEAEPTTITTEIKPTPDVPIATRVLEPLITEIASGIKEFNKGTFGDIPCGDSEQIVNFKLIIDTMNYLNLALKKIDGFVMFQTPSDSSWYRTKMQDQPRVDSISTSYLNKYTFESGKKKAVFGYRVNKLYRFWPSAGFVNSLASQPEVLINDDGSLKTKFYNGPKTIVGLKIYPCKTSIMDPHFVVACKKRNPCFDYRKLYFFMGVNAVSPAKEYFIGTGLDLWSGFSITGGSHIIRKKQQYYVNGSVESHPYLDWKNIYLGINIDITLAVKAVRFFIEK